MATKTAKTAKTSKKIEIRGISDRSRTCYGHTYAPITHEDWNADVVKGKSIRLFGVNGTQSEKAFDLTFLIGDEAEYDSYNLVYTGKIVGITDKTVTIEKYGRRHRLSIYTFAWRNWDFNATEIFLRNQDTMMYI